MLFCQKDYFFAFAFALGAGAAEKQATMAQAEKYLACVDEL